MSDSLPLPIASLRNHHRLLAERQVLRVDGEDARSWLNGQITNNIIDFDASSALYALIVNLKGKILADVWALIRDDETIDLLVPSGTRSMLLEYLDGFIIMEDVELRDDVSDVYHLCFESEPAQSGLSWSLAYLGLEAKLSTEVGSGTPIEDKAWLHAHHTASRPLYGIDFGDNMLPQEAGLKELAVSFNKGCYQGQEAIVMLEHRGKPPKRLVNLELHQDPTEDLTKGSPIRDESGKEVGALTLVLESGGSHLIRGWLGGSTLERPDASLSIAGASASITSLIG
jgi:hypothetical protein